MEKLVVQQLQRALKKVDYLDPFQPGFIPKYGTEMALLTLWDDL